MKSLLSILLMKYRVDDWVGYCPLPDIEYFKNERHRALILAVLDTDPFYDYKIYVEETHKIKKVREHQLFPDPGPTY
jgi:hypothetical protein